MNAPLDGVRVLDFTRVLSGPPCTRMLCDLGADIVKVETPDGDVTRFAPPRRNSMTTYYAQQNTGKRSVSIDLARPEGQHLALELATKCDVLVENYRPGVMERLGLGYDAVAAASPGIVYASITGYGATGPWRNRRAYAPMVQAETGHTKSQGDHGRGGVYRTDRHSHADVYTSLDAAAAIAGNPCSNGNFEMYLAAIGRQDLAADPRFATVADRRANIDGLVGHIAAFAATVSDVETLEAAFGASRLAVGAVRSVTDVCDSDWAQQRDAVVEVDDRGGGTFRIPNAPWKFSDAPGVGVSGTPRYRDEDNTAVLRDVLGMADDEISALAEAGVLSERRRRR